MVVSAPTSSGKTVIFELSIIKHSEREQKIKCLYLAPIKSLCHEKVNSWAKKFGKKLKIHELTGDTTLEEEEDLNEVDVAVATPEKIDAYSRKNMEYLRKVNLLLIDEVHMLNFEERGATLEAVVSRLMSISNPRIIALSATIPNIKEVAEWLKVPPEFICVFGA